jgi:TRAP-type C4-dicarboxylate transport system permease small subunit
VWVPELVLPLTFAIMTLRFVFRSLKNLSSINSPPKANRRQGKV